MIPTKNKKESAAIAEQIKEFEKLNGKIKTTPIQYRGKTLKAESMIDRDMRISREKGNNKSAKMSRKR